LRATILDSVGANSPLCPGLSENLRAFLDQKGIECHVLELDHLNILPCVGCEGCLRKTPGMCVMKDDTRVLVNELAVSHWIVGITQMRFGGYSAQLKKVVDKFALLASPFYYVHKRKLLHPPRYGCQQLLMMVGLGWHFAEETHNFSLLVRNNAMNLSIDAWLAPVFPSGSISEKVVSGIGQELERRGFL